jgi:hypothetical protein
VAGHRSVVGSSSDCLAGWQPSGEDAVRSGPGHLDPSSELAESSDSDAFDLHLDCSGTVGLQEVVACRRCSGWRSNSSTAAGCDRQRPDCPGCTRPRHGRCSLLCSGSAVATVTEDAAGHPEEQTARHPSSFSSSGQDVGASRTSIGPSSPISAP